MNSSLPGVLSGGIFDSRSKFPGKTVTAVRTVENYELELSCADRGISHINENISAPLFWGSILLARPGDRRHSTLPVRCYFIHFTCHDEKLCRMIDAMPRIMERMDFEKYAPRFKLISGAILSTDEYSGISAAGELINLLYNIYKDCKFSMKNGVPTSNAVLEAKHYIDEHFSVPITASEIARACGLSESYLYRIFLRTLGTTPHNYLLSRRIAAAKEALITSDLPLSQVAEECGFQSQAHFCYCFKKETGMSPREFRYSVDYPA